MRLFHHANDLGQRRVGAHAASAQRQATGAVDRATRHRIAVFLPDGDRLSRDHAFVYVAGTVCHLRIDRNPLAGPNDNHIAHHQVVNIHLDRRAVAQDARRANL